MNSRTVNTRWIGLAITTIVSALTICAALRTIATARNRNAPVPVYFLSMGTAASATFYGGDAEKGALIVREAFEEVEAAASIFRADSPVARLNATGSVRLQAATPGRFDLAALLRRTLDASRETDGAFDPTVNPLMALWGFRASGAPASEPTDEAVAAACGRVGWTNVVIAAAPDDGTSLASTDISFARPGMELDLGGIAKGAAIDYAFDKLRSAGFDNFLLNLGGNIRVSGGPEDGRDEWHVAVRDPANPSQTTGQTVVLRSGEAVATSGSYERYVEIDGRRYSHIIDPRTGRPVERQGSVSVIADTAERADALSTAFFVQGLGAADGSAAVFRAP